MNTNMNRIASELEALHKSQAYICAPDDCISFTIKINSPFSILHQNIRSINKNIDQLVAFLSLIKVNCDIIVLSECWLSKIANIPVIDGYNSHKTLNVSNQNEGIVIYTKADLECTICEPEYIKDFNCLICKIGKDLAIVTVYRSPASGNTENFLNGLEKVLMTLNTYTNVCILGDMNIDIKTNNSDSRSGDYLNLMASYGFLPTHQYPTRAENCLDHVLVKSQLESVTLIPECYITDHCPTLFTVSLKKKSISPSPCRTKINYSAIRDILTQVDFMPALNSGDANFAANYLVDVVSDIIRNNTSHCKIPRKKRIIKPWITPGLIRCIHNRDRMHKSVKREPTNMTLKISYIRYRNFINKLLKNLKTLHNKNLLEDAKNNSKATWEAIKTITHTNIKKTSPVLLLSTKETPQLSVNAVNHFFINIGKELATRIQSRTPPSSSLCTVMHSPSQCDSLVLLQTDAHEIELLIKNLRRDCAVGYDNISAAILQSSIDVFVPVLTHICQLSLSTGVFPNVFKRAIVYPIHKSGDGDVVDNYRPISVLPAMSKVLEKVLYVRLNKFLNSKGIISDSQFGFRKKKSTVDAVSSLVDKVVDYLDKKEKCLGLFLDLSKAFDTVSIPILMSKLERIGVRGLALDIFQDYLSNRTQAVKVGECISDDAKLCFGVPQGSILGPLLFTIYINDLCELKSPNCQVFAYADDTALLIHGPNWDDVKAHAETALRKAMFWLSSNLLTLNITKTNFITFGMKISGIPPAGSFFIKSHTCVSHSSNNCDCPTISRTTTVKYLGIKIDQSLKWQAHIDSLTSRVRKLIYVFKLLRNAASLETLKMTYQALCQSIISYCILAWGGAAKTILLPLERAQRAVLKVMAKKIFRYPTSKLYKEVGVLSVRQLFIQHTLTKKHASLTFDPLLYQNKRRSDIVCPSVRHRTVMAKRHYMVISGLLYNRINRKLNLYPLKQTEFKKKLVSWLLQLNYIETENLLNQ